jgi:cell division protein FtsW (lipid II flippase)
MNVHVPNLSDTAIGVLIMIGGIVLFLHATNIITVGLTAIILVASIIMIIYGGIKAHIYQRIMKLFNRKKATQSASSDMHHRQERR